MRMIGGMEALRLIRGVWGELFLGFECFLVDFYVFKYFFVILFIILNVFYLFLLN
jgi:hypothetical protein